MPSASLPAGFAGLWIPLVTPFDADGAVDHAALRALVARLAPHVAGFVACGSTGEAAALDDAERLAVLDTVLDAVGPLPVVMGISGYHLGHTLDAVRALAARPIAGLLVPPPHTTRPSQAGIVQWFTALADAAHVPLIVYDIPYRTGAVLETATLLELAAHPNIRAVKDCGGSPAKTQALIADGRLQVLAGEDAQILTTAALGGAGAIAASAHWRADAFAAVLRHVAAGELPAARAVWASLQPWVADCFAEPNPAPVKALLAQAGWIRNVLRAPMTAASPALERQLSRRIGPRV
ncbi:4-hydroxy-tetrahydrodipicolinate synthase family protein [Xylophilus sp.]|uniref:4-hydroxy-tetrahydrodipicolinate synthase family protein n=1 Tax=Xylophilus sp. TaxID=2653893 RepID=UPI0013BBB059|nr:4-hydroxy-tetrahydrodipicolinate synthase [Xylophilus sp.]KAF1045838.1 MAG: 4-hydroxy-tetrahydrodipicolinate synthase [Xylophilus sp.]